MNQMRVRRNRSFAQVGESIDVFPRWMRRERLGRDALHKGTFVVETRENQLALFGRPGFSLGQDAQRMHAWMRSFGCRRAFERGIVELAEAFEHPKRVHFLHNAVIALKV